MKRFSTTTPQKFDSVVRSFTAASLALILVTAVVILAFTASNQDRLTSLQAVLVGWAGVVVGFYFGGHVAQNTAALEELRQVTATISSEASAVRSEASAVRSESSSPTPSHKEETDDESTP